MPVTTPDGSTVATSGLPDDQVAPGVALDKVVVEPSHTLVAPVIAAGSGFTTTGVDVRQPAGKV